MNSSQMESSFDDAPSLTKLKELFEHGKDEEHAIDFSEAVSMHLKSLPSDESLECALYALENAVRCIVLEDLEESLFALACPIISESFTTAIIGINRLDEGVQLTQSVIDPIYALLTSCSVTLQTLSTVCAVFEEWTKVPFRRVRTLLLTLKDVIAAADPVVLKLQSEKYALCGGVFKDDLSNLKKQFLNILTSRVKISPNDDSDLDDLSDIVATCVRTLQASPPSLETMGATLETWKAVINLSQYLKDGFDMSEGIAYLCDSLLNFLEKPIEPTSSDLKMYNILLKVLVSLCKLFRIFTKNCWKSILSLLITLFGLTPAYLTASGLSASAAEGMTNNLANGATPFLAVFLSAQPSGSSHDFAPLLMDRIRTEVSRKPYGCLLLLLSLLKKLAASSGLRKAYFNDDANVLEAVFDSLGYCHSGIMQDLYPAPGIAPADLYEHTVIIVSAFVLTLTPDEFTLAEETMWVSIIQTNPWRALLASDILCVVARYADSGLCHSMVENMISVVKDIHDPNSRPEFVYITALLKRMLPLCQSDFIENLSNRYSECSSAWSVLGLHLVSSQREEEFVGSVRKWLEDCSENVDGIQKLEALATTGKDAALIASISDLSDDLWHIESSTVVPLRYLSATLSVTAGGISNLSSHSILDVTHRILRLSSEPGVNPSALLCILQFLDRCADCKLPSDSNIVSALENFGNTFKSILDSKNSALRILALKTLMKFAESSHHTRVVKVAAGAGSSFYSDFVSFVKKELPSPPEDLSFPCEHVHRCSEQAKAFPRVDCAGTVAKKLKLEQRVDNETSAVIRNFEKITSDILLLVPRFTDLERGELLRACQNLSSKLG